MYKFLQTAGKTFKNKSVHRPILGTVFCGKDELTVTDSYLLINKKSEIPNELQNKLFECSKLAKFDNYLIESPLIDKHLLESRPEKLTTKDYPNFKQAFPTGEPVHTVKLNPELLMRALKFFHKEKDVFIDVYNDMQPFVIRREDTTALIMPLKK